MESKVEVLTLGELKKQILELEKNTDVTDETKIFLDTGWDSIQEIAPDAFSVQKAQTFTVEDVLTNESFSGYSLSEKAEKMNASGEEETVIILQNLY